MTVISITFCTDLPTKAQNQLRYRMELKVWKDQWKEAKSKDDFETMDRLDRQLDWVGLP